MTIQKNASKDIMAPLERELAQTTGASHLSVNFPVANPPRSTGAPPACAEACA